MVIQQFAIRAVVRMRRSRWDHSTPPYTEQIPDLFSGMGLELTDFYARVKLRHRVIQKLVTVTTLRKPKTSYANSTVRHSGCGTNEEVPLGPFDAPIHGANP